MEENIGIKRGHHEMTLKIDSTSLLSPLFFIYIEHLNYAHCICQSLESIVLAMINSLQLHAMMSAACGTVLSSDWDMTGI